jgi:hypothetical protein
VIFDTPALEGQWKRAQTKAPFFCAIVTYIDLAARRKFARDIRMTSLYRPHNTASDHYRYCAGDFGISKMPSDPNVAQWHWLSDQTNKRFGLVRKQRNGEMAPAILLELHELGFHPDRGEANDHAHVACRYAW